MCLFLLPCSACSSSPALPVHPIHIPSALVQPVPEPSLDGIVVNNDLVTALLDYRDALRVCNSQLTAIGAAYAKPEGRTPNDAASNSDK